MLGLLLIFFFTLFLFFYNKFTKKFQFWEKKDVPHSKPKIPFGNLENPLNVTKPMFMICNELYKRFRKENQNHFGKYLFFNLKTENIICFNVLTFIYFYISTYIYLQF